MPGTGLLLALFETSANDRGESLNFKASAGYIMLNPVKPMPRTPIRTVFRVNDTGLPRGYALAPEIRQRLAGRPLAD